jgi:hypothetical protein
MCNDLIFFGGSVNTGVLQIAGGVALDSTLRFVEDQAGTDSALKLATNKASFDTGNTIFNVDAGFNFGRNGTPVFNFLNYALSAYVEPYFDCLNFRFRCYGSNGVTITDSSTTTPNGALTVKSLGANIASFRDSANVEKGYFTNDCAAFQFDINGLFVNNTIRGLDMSIGSGGSLFRLSKSSDGIGRLSNNADNNFTRLQLGGTTTDFPAIESSNTPATLAAKNATGANLIPFSAEDFTSGNLTTGTLTTARPMQFGDKGTITTGNDLSLDAQIAVEHNGNVYYIPCSTSLIT